MPTELMLTAAGQRQLNKIQDAYDNGELDLKDFLKSDKALIYTILTEIDEKGFFPNGLEEYAPVFVRAGLVVPIDEDAELQLVDEFEGIGRY